MVPKLSTLDKVFKNPEDAKNASVLQEKAAKPLTPRSGGLRKDGCPTIVINAISSLKDYGAIKGLVDGYKKIHPKKYDTREFIIYILTGLRKQPKGLTKMDLAHANAVLAEAKTTKK